MKNQGLSWVIDSYVRLLRNELPVPISFSRLFYRLGLFFVLFHLVIGVIYLFAFIVSLLIK